MIEWYRRWQARRKADHISKNLGAWIDAQPLPGWADESLYRRDVDPEFLEILDLHRNDVSWPNTHIEETLTETELDKKSDALVPCTPDCDSGDFAHSIR